MFKSKLTSIVAVTALVVAVLGTTPLGHAAGNLVLTKNSVGSKQVINGSLLTKDLSKSTIAALRGARGAQGVQGPQGVQGAQGVQGNQGPAGTARAYGYVAADGTPTRSKNVVGITRPYSNVYCIQVAAGIDAGQTGLVATPDWLNDSTSFSTNGSQTIVEWQSNASSCPSGQFEVVTGVRQVSTAGSADGDVHAISNGYHAEPFFFVVP